MSKNVFPVLRYLDAGAAIDWLERAFGLERVEVSHDDDGKVAHAELRFGDSVVMLSDEDAGNPAFGKHAGQGWLYAVVDDPDAQYQRAKAAGAEIVMELTDQDYGSRDFSARDLEGNLWSFGTYDPTA